ncbi:hypothetical protein ONZ51_g4223 [Trametes cubensis]|uniref:Fungal-type protein kinase domain-containing protein n=1 Tax=Trametes cubensis TaxID=1111947 RepID=A0AAD7XAG1_9APHY|nr:hypothetical protein ONZ51_g4223 [Trametes cubensis]
MGPLNEESTPVIKCRQGSTIFAATSVLKVMAGMLSPKGRSDDANKLIPAAFHDSESFAWVFLYVLYQRALQNPELQDNPIEHAALEGEFARHFSGASVQKLYSQRMVSLYLASSGSLQAVDALLKYARDYEQFQRLEDTLKHLWLCLGRGLRKGHTAVIHAQDQPFITEPRAIPSPEHDVARVVEHTRAQPKAELNTSHLDHVYMSALLNTMLEAQQDP